MAKGTMQSKVVILGSGTPNPDPERMGPALAVVVNDAAYVVDFGPGVVRRAAAAYTAGVEQLEVTRLKIAFLTHLHSDHTAGYPDLILTPWVMGRDEPLQVYGPAGLKDMTEHILAAYTQDKDQRIRGLEPIDPNGYGAVAHEISAGRAYQDDNVAVDAFLVDHGEWGALGFRFTTPDRVIVISGDTAPTDSLIKACHNCDLLIHEVYSSTGFARRQPLWQRYHAHMHTSAKQLAQIASKIRPGLLVLVHQLFWGVSDEVLIKEIRQDYDGRVVSARDLDIL